MVAKSNGHLGVWCVIAVTAAAVITVARDRTEPARRERAATARPVAATSGWIDRTTGVPQARMYAAAAYDGERKNIVLFGGETQQQLLGDTWVLDGNAWSERQVPGPSPRKGHAVAYDPVRKTVVLYGGRSATEPLADTWEWDGTAWSRIVCESSPPPLSHHLMVRAEDLGAILLFGGAGAEKATNECWLWDGDRWKRRDAGKAPAAWSSHGRPSMAYDPVRGRTVFYNGQSIEELWELAGGRWTRVEPKTPVTGRWDAAMTFDPSRNRVLLAGGVTDSTPMNDTVEWDGTDYSRLSGESRYDMVYGHCLVYDEARERAVLISNRGSWTFADSVWNPLESDGAPAAGGASAMAWDAGSEAPVLFCGNATQRTWLWDGRSWSPARTGAEPSQRTGFALAADSARREVLLFGGSAGPSTALGDTWMWKDGSWNQLTPATAPSPRMAHSMAYDVKRRCIVLFGGKSSSFGPPSFETWEWTQSEWRQGPPGPSARARCGLAFDEARGRIVLYGGEDFEDEPLRETWEYDGAWTLASGNSGMEPARSTALAFDPGRNRVVLVGGEGERCTYHDETWEWDGKIWTERKLPTFPPWRAGAALTYDPLRKCLVLFGGNGTQGPLADTWELAGK